MEKTLRKFASFKEAKDEEYRYWHSVSPEERFADGHELSVEGYRASGYSAVLRNSAFADSRKSTRFAKVTLQRQSA